MRALRELAPEVKPASNAAPKFAPHMATICRSYGASRGLGAGG